MVQVLGTDLKGDDLVEHHEYWTITECLAFISGDPYLHRRVSSRV